MTIIMMADSIIEVANAIKSTTRASKDRKLFTKLMTELSNILEFYEQEIDTIYENLSKNF